MKRLLPLLVAVSLVIVNSSVFAQLTPKTLFIKPDMVMAKVNPTGSYVVSVHYNQQQPQLYLYDTNTSQQSLLLDLKGVFNENANISQLHWLDMQHIAVQLTVTKKGIEDLLDTKLARRLIIIKLPNEKQQTKVYSVRTKGWLVHPLPQQQGEFLYAKSGLYSKVYRIKVNKLALEGKKLNKLTRVDGGQFKFSNEIKRIDGYATRWFFDYLGEPKAVLHFDNKLTLTLSSYQADGSVTVVNTWSNSESETETSQQRLLPVSFAGEDNSFYCLDLNEQEKRTVYLKNFKTGEQQVVYEANSYQIVNLVRAQDSDSLAGVKVINNGVVETIYINDDKEQVANSQVLTTPVNSSLDGKHAVFYRQSHGNAGQFILRTAEQEKLLGEKYPQLSGKTSDNFVQDTVNVNELAIPYLLSLPTKKSNSFPLIVLPHGGPVGVYDNHYYNPIVQLFNAQNYAVLQVNFRGSSGFSHALKAAGKDQWGELMLEDIHQATLAVTKRNDIDANNICVFGMSYGGYAAMMLSIKHPELYKCAANWAGVTDLNLYIHHPRINKKQKKWAREHIGLMDWDLAKLNQYSPIYMAEQVTQPLFMAYGTQDKIVDIEHGYRMKLMLDKADKDYLWQEFSEANHSFGSPKIQQAFFQQLLSFLSTHLQKK